MVLAPTCASRIDGIAYCDRGSTVDRGFLELAIGKESHPLSIGREERVGGTFAAHQKHRLSLIQTTGGEKLSAILAAGREYQPPAVARYDHARARPSEGVRPNVHLQTGERVIHRCVQLPQPYTCHQ